MVTRNHSSNKQPADPLHHSLAVYPSSNKDREDIAYPSSAECLKTHARLR